MSSFINTLISLFTTIVTTLLAKQLGAPPEVTTAVGTLIGYLAHKLLNVSVTTNS